MPLLQASLAGTARPAQDVAGEREALGIKNGDILNFPISHVVGLAGEEVTGGAGIGRGSDRKESGN